MRQAEDRWRSRWREAVRRAGRSRACRGEDAKFLAHGLRLDTFLKNPDVVTRILEGDFDDNKAERAAPSSGFRPVVIFGTQPPREKT